MAVYLYVANILLTLLSSTISIILSEIYSTSDLGGHCYLWLSVVVEITVFELVMVESRRFDVEKQHIGLYRFAN